MSAVGKVTRAVSTVGGIASALSLKVEFNDAHGDVQAVKLLSFLPLFRRDVNGRAKILGIRAQRFDR